MRERSGQILRITCLVLGALLVLFPGAGAVAVLWWIGAYAIVFGALLLALAFKLRNWERAVTHGIPRAA